MMEEKKGLDIVRASAGSGKTFLLAKTYIGLLLESTERYAYRHILAVTFTNKATDEMKSRIIKELDILARDPAASDYHDEFVKRFGPDAKLRERAENFLFDILHDYGSFSVSTIDRFFQTTLKAFARELGQFSAYQVELDKDSLVRESVDRMLDNLTEKDKVLLKWLKDNAMEQLESGRKANVDKTLYEMASALKSDAHREAVERLGPGAQAFLSREDLAGLRKKCRACRKQFEKDVEDCARAVKEVFEKAGVPLGETNRGFAKAIDKYIGMEPGAVPPLTPSFMDKAGDSKKWFAASKSGKYLPMLEGVLEDKFGELLKLFGRPYDIYNTAGILDSQIYGLGAAAEFDSEFEALVKEKNVLAIDDSNTLLRKIIDGSDAPFVYEKLGVRYDSFLLDEFQDTSAIQWENFRPLLRESGSRGKKSLIVGDVKQSIYRWRGSDWDLLGSRVKKEFPLADDGSPLQNNWRSYPGIVIFNREFFAYAAPELDRIYAETFPGAGERDCISKIYADAWQEPMIKGEASLEFVFLAKEDTELDELVRIVKDLCPDGKGYGDVAVLVRDHSAGSMAAARLLAEGISVISDDSLEVKSSVTVRRLAALMHLAASPEDKVSRYMAGSLGVEIPERYLSLTGLAEGFLRGLEKADPETFASETLFIQSFMDTLQDWIASTGGTLGAFLEYWDGLGGQYVSSPGDPDAVRIMTVHKSKGLEFPHVIIPFAENVTLFKDGPAWCAPDLGDTPLDGTPQSVYNVRLSSKSASTLFRGDYMREVRMQYVDNLNVAYVAFTRACRSLHVIAACSELADSGKKSEKSSGKKSEKSSGKSTPSCISDILYSFLCSHMDGFELETGEDGTRKVFRKGALSAAEPETKKKKKVLEWNADYPSCPLNSDENPGRGRLRFSADSREYFGGEMSARLNGIALHGILAAVRTPADLPGAVAAAVRNGTVPAGRAEEYRALLSDRIASVAGKGWFPDDPALVENEVSLMDTDGEVYRPDRVVRDGGRTLIIDYKFGDENPRYMAQIAKYASLYRAMGEGPVTACLWYLYENKIVYLPESNQ